MHTKSPKWIAKLQRKNSQDYRYIALKSVFTHGKEEREKTIIYGWLTSDKLHPQSQFNSTWTRNIEAMGWEIDIK